MHDLVAGRVDLLSANQRRAVDVDLPRGVDRHAECQRRHHVGHLANDHGVGIAEGEVKRFELAAEVLDDFLHHRASAAASLLQQAPGPISGVLAWIMNLAIAYSFEERASANTPPQEARACYRSPPQRIAPKSHGARAAEFHWSVCRDGVSGSGWHRATGRLRLLRYRERGYRADPFDDWPCLAEA